MPSSRLLLTLLMATTLLSGCATAPPSAVVTKACPAMKEYAAAFEARVADEMARLAPDDPLRVWAEDYIGARDQTKACRAS